MEYKFAEKDKKILELEISLEILKLIEDFEKRKYKLDVSVSNDYYDIPIKRAVKNILDILLNTPSEIYKIIGKII